MGEKGKDFTQRIFPKNSVPECFVLVFLFLVYPIIVGCRFADGRRLNSRFDGPRSGKKIQWHYSREDWRKKTKRNNLNTRKKKKKNFHQTRSNGQTKQKRRLASKN